MSHDVALALVALGTAVVAASAVGALAVGGDVYDRLHFLTPVTSLGAPLVGVGLCVENGWGLTAAEILLVVALLFLAGPALEAATARLIGQTDGRVTSESPK